MQMIHLTFSGPESGKPFCGCDKVKEIGKGHIFIHYYMWPVTDKEILEDPEVCEDCKEVLREIIEEESGG